MVGSFSFPYMVMTVTATLDGSVLTVKQGIRTFEVPIDRLRYLYVKRHSEQFEELILAYEAMPEQFKHVRVFSNAGVQGFRALVDALVAAKPSADIRAMQAAEAFKLMRATDTEKIAMIAVPVLVVLAMAVLGLPWLVHGLDSGRAMATPADLASGKALPSRNLELVGVIDLEHSMREDTTRKGVTSSKYFFPVVDETWVPGQPVQVVLETGSLSAAEAGALADAGRVSCTLRDVLWEGLSGDQRDFFETDYKLVLSKDVRLCEHAPGAPNELVIFGAVMGVTVLVMVIVMIVIAVKRRRA